MFLEILAHIVASPVKAERQGQLRERFLILVRNALPIVDEIGYLPLSPGVPISSSSTSEPAASAAP